MQQAAYAGHADAAGLRFGFPRIYLAQQLRRKMIEQLYLGPASCVLGRRGAGGNFVALAEHEGDDFDGPAFTLRLRHAAGAYQVFDHDIDLEVSILFGRYLLAVDGHRFEIAFLPAMDDALLTTAVRWIVRKLEHRVTAR